MNIIEALSTLFFGSSEQRQIARILSRRYHFSGDQDDWLAGQKHYADALELAGFDPASLANEIDAALQVSFDAQFQLGANAPELRAQQPVEQHRLKPGDAGFIREEALRTFQATGVYGLPSYGGHILTKEERKIHGLP
ncbi:hypothetical protein [uncultured Litoreibacter sp.]|uniref:hypothetical protein n=1 Tax=uncultured Litoreibacter sp. TaxID=1392394 RepID=UPI00262FD271|nr:hypothetical protein [uncultured Litoreibacter sp.]